MYNLSDTLDFVVVQDTSDTFLEHVFHVVGYKAIYTFVYKYCRSEFYMVLNRHHNTFLKEQGRMCGSGDIHS